MNPQSNTIYTVNATSSSGCVSSTTVGVTVAATGVPTVSISGNTIICAGESTTLTANGSGSDYLWDSGQTTSSVIVSPSVTTSYSVISSGISCSTSFTNLTVISVSVNLSPTISAVSYTNTSCGLNNGEIMITSSPSNNNFAWSSGVMSSTNSASFLTPGNYTITVFNGACSASTIIPISGSVPLQITSSSVTASNCGAENGSISVSDNYASSIYAWSPIVSSFNTIDNLASGTYSLSITNGACSTTTLFTVTQLSGPNEINTTKIGAICENSNGSISITSVSNGVFPYQYSFNNSGYSSITTYSNLTQGVYTITVKDTYGCIFTQTVTVDKTMLNTSIDLTTNYPSCNSNDGSFVINNISGGIPPFLLSFNGFSYSTDTIFEQLGYGNYSLTVKDSNSCKTSFVLDLLGNRNDYTLYIPNTFTPNKDIINDIWFISGTCIKKFKCFIYNRWGEKIIEINNIIQGWDGTYKGEPVPDGVYVYLIEIDTNEGAIYKNGHITLFR